MKKTLANISVQAMGLSTRAVNSLLSAGITTFGEMYEVAMTGKLAHLRNIGKICVAEITNKINEMYQNKDAILDRIKLKEQFEQTSREIEKTAKQLKELETKRETTNGIN